MTKNKIRNVALGSILCVVVLQAQALSGGSEHAKPTERSVNPKKVPVTRLADAACKRATKCSKRKYKTGTVVWTISVKR